ncbi:AraC family transcriptional regulator [Gallibacterium salpingitidis]|uniref:HTH araC/xylS-type domain-containing protein n=1 Tax=Gallibacterium salpingitidis TaxID=505341 RepID=A0A1A7P153_9PAST|nr:AraC family transcriptional regulator [Gallibacterium salpingitidis]OBW94964.1 hypothetical protein QS62_04755 [Gallibacterium salpingitidis]
MININKKHLKKSETEWKTTLSPLLNSSIPNQLLFSTDITDFSKKTIAHSHTWVQFIYTRTGTVYVEINNQFWHLPPLHGVWIPKNYEHTFWSSEKAEYISININDRFAPYLEHIHCQVVEVSPLIDAYTEYLMQTTKQPTKDLALKEQTFISLLTELAPVNFTLPYPNSPELLTLCRAIQSEPSLPHTPENCARILNISLSTFIRRFKKETGMTYQEWRQQMRLLHSITRLKKGDNILNIALDSGYSSSSSYIYAFKKHFGVSPTKYINNS